MMQLHNHFFTIICSIAFIFYPFTTQASAPPFGELKVHFIDVGQGDSMLVTTPTNKHILIDGGPPGSGNKIIAYLKKQGIRKLDLLIATHPDMDHIGGLPDVMKKIKVKKILDSGKLHTTRAYRKYIREIHQRKIPLEIAQENTSIDIDPQVQIQILNAYKKGKNNNESSIALKIGYKEIDFLLMSDVERKQEKKFIKKFNVEAEILKVAHHGSRTSSSFAFLKHVRPRIAIITYSKENDYGHPVHRVIRNLYKLKTEIYSTAVYGDIVIHTNGRDFYLIPEKSPLEGIDSDAG
ncbi:MBL fold metallo-hydrolase [Virgibacillus sp. LDC-1]|uniref:ComEC/Rec2 family competence protein n=1 Tax=Virgibacillus sp. LDC-1 TaxID=3039856 RepID=UPI0024DE1A99|nr:MBL fold metallo-hydrolase [Virgibacillus sp. LDC-1]